MTASSRLARFAVPLAAIVLLAAGCGGTIPGDSSETGPVSSSENLCRRTKQFFDLSDGNVDPAERPCFGDTILARLEPDGAGRTREISVDIPQSGRVRLCFGLIDHFAHQLQLVDAQGTALGQLRQGDGCVDVSITAGTHTLRLTNGQPIAPNAKGYVVFIHPTTTLGAAAPSSGLIGAYNISSDCPNCDLHGVNFSNTSLLCGSDVTDDCADPNPANYFCLFASLRAAPAYWMGNDFSGSRFSGAKFDGAQFECVNFRGAQFYDTQYGVASMHSGATCCGGFVSPAPAAFNGCDFRGASLRNIDLTVASLACTTQTSEGLPLLFPSDLGGADLRGANLSNVNFSVSACPWQSSEPNPYCPSANFCFRLGLEDAIVDTTTNLTNANLGGADLSGWDWHKVDWSTMSMQWAVFGGGDMSGIDFTSAPYAGKFFIANKSADRFANADFSRMDLSKATFTHLDLTNAVMASADLTGATLTNATLNGANFTRANLAHAILDSVAASSSAPATFNSATLQYASLQNASLSKSFFRGAALNPANLGNADLSGALLEDVSPPQFGRTSLAGSFMLNTKLNGAHLTGAVLDGVSWYNVSPASPVASGANAFLTGASFVGAALPGLELTGAHLDGATMTGAQLIGANLSNASLNGANLSGTDLAGTNLSAANLSGAILTNAFVDAFAASEIYINVLADPKHYENPIQYNYFAVDRCQTQSTSATIFSVDTLCPDGSSGGSSGCGPIACPTPPADANTTCPKWVAPNPPLEPANCTPTPDMNGNIVGLYCVATRKPVPTNTPPPGATPTSTPSPKPGTPTPTPTPSPHPVTCHTG